jgi:hypothetical protein
MDEKHTIKQAIADYFDAANTVNKSLANQELSDAPIRNLAIRSYEVLRAYASPENWPDWDRNEISGHPIVPLPQQLAADLARQIYLLANRHIPRWMLDLQKQGSPINDPRLQEAIGLALAYKKLCEVGRINNKWPVKTISNAYGVTRRGVQLWAKEYPADPELFFPQASSEDERALMILAEMPKAAARYREWGRGTNNPRPHGKAQRRPRAK